MQLPSLGQHVMPKLHYPTTPGFTLCRMPGTLNCTLDVDRVTCKHCIRVLAKQVEASVENPIPSRCLCGHNLTTHLHQRNGREFVGDCLVCSCRMWAAA